VSDTEKRTGLALVPDAAAVRIRDCFECAEPIPIERGRSSFCSDTCRHRRQKRRRRECVRVQLEIDEAALEFQVDRGPIGSVWGVLCNREVAEALREEARPPPRRRRRVPFPKNADIAGDTLDA